MAFATETRDLTKRFRKTKSYREILLHPFAKQEIVALRDVSLKVKAGEVFALVGPNGAGKTTLIKMLSTLIVPTSGDAFVAGYDVRRHVAQIKRRIGCVVTEERSFYWRLTGRQNLEFFAVLNNVPKSAVRGRVKEVLALMRLEKDADKTFKEYSTGMRHRLAIGRALLTDPEILFFDEPTKSLDPPTAELIRGMVGEFVSRSPGRTVLFATHDLQEAEELASRIAILHRGELKACGTPAQLRKIVCRERGYTLKLRQPNERVVKMLARLAVSDRRGEGGVVDEARFLIEIGDSEDISSVIRELVLAGGRLVECTPVSSSLSDVFHFLTQD